MMFNDRFKTRGGTFHGNRPCYAFTRVIAAPSHFGIKKTISLVLHRIVKVHSLRTQHALIDGMIFVSFNSDATFTIFFNNDTAPYSAIRARGLKTFFNAFTHLYSALSKIVISSSRKIHYAATSLKTSVSSMATLSIRRLSRRSRMILYSGKFTVSFLLRGRG